VAARISIEVRGREFSSLFAHGQPHHGRSRRGRRTARAYGALQHGV